MAWDSGFEVEDLEVSWFKVLGVVGVSWFRASEVVGISWFRV